MDYNLWD
jgi:hypothetical protein